MMRRVWVLAALFAVVTPAVALANEGILLLAHNGSPEWNTQVQELATKVDTQKPAEIALGTPTRSMIAASVNRLVKRGVTAVTAVPFFLSTPIAPEHLTGHAVPISLAPASAEDPVFAEIIVSCADDVSSAGNEMLVLWGYGADDAGQSWVVDLAPSVQRMMRTRRFGGILFINRPADATEIEEKQSRVWLDRLGSARSIVVVPMLMSADGPDPLIAKRLQGYRYEVAARGIMSDDRLVQWVAGQSPIGTSRR